MPRPQYGHFGIGEDEVPSLVGCGKLALDGRSQRR